MKTKFFMQFHVSTLLGPKRPNGTQPQAHITVFAKTLGNCITIQHIHNAVFTTNTSEEIKKASNEN